MADQPDSQPQGDDQTQPPPAQPPDEGSTSRRGFFREALAGLLGPVANLIQDRLRFDLYDEPADYAGVRPPLRPPGAVAGEAFADLCDHCGDCAAACPASAIVMDPDPRVVPAEQACLMCGGFPCVAACPTGALAGVGRDELCMGLAVWDPSACQLTAGGRCWACRDACPVAGAVTIGQYYVDVDSDKCTGCGMCEQACPQHPRGIVVEPF